MSEQMNEIFAKICEEADNRIADLERQRDAAVEALQYAVKQVPELGTVPGIAAVLAEIEGKS